MGRVFQARISLIMRFSRKRTFWNLWMKGLRMGVGRVPRLVAEDSKPSEASGVCV